MANSWSEEDALLYWSRRTTNTVIMDCRENTTIAQYVKEVSDRNERENHEREAFLKEWTIDPRATDAFGRDNVTTISNDLTFWAKNSSWCYCKNCGSLSTVKLMPTFSNKIPPKSTVSCACSTSRYVVPRFESIPQPLQNLSRENVLTLRPFMLDCGQYQRAKHGYRQKTAMINITISPLSVHTKISALTSETDRVKCLNAYTYLMSSELSMYSHFVNLRDELLATSAGFNTFDMEKTKGIECALWPNLYPYTDWTESSLCGKESRLSGKVGFMVKIMSGILDYSLHFDLLQFQYDRWMYKVVSGAINTARFSNCSPARALDSKTFSPTYWQWQHRFLLDAVEQFGWPDVFITLSPFEWSFPFPKWLEDARDKTFLGPTKLAAYETLHIAHVLEQIVRGYLCGSNSNRWTKHVFSYNRIATKSNIKTYFYRFEFQQRGTVHLHLLVWLNNITQIQHQLIRADIPTDNEDLAFLVQKLQRSNKSAHSLNVQPQATYFESKDGKPILHLKHPAKEFALNLRAYISTLTHTLKCSMDFQTTDGKSMLLRYVTSYVTKTHDAVSIDSLYSKQLEGRQAAIRHLMVGNPAEPEMWLSLASTKIAWSPSRTKRFTAPTTQSVATNKTVEKYWKREKVYETFSLIQWLRACNEQGVKCTPYKSGSTLVGVKTLTIFNIEHFFQYALLQIPHRQIAGIMHPQQDRIPERLKWFAACAHNVPQLWNSDQSLTVHFQMEGHRNTHIATILSYIASLRDLYHLWQISIISSSDLDHITPTEIRQAYSLDGQQMAVKSHIVQAVMRQEEYYRGSSYRALHDSDSDSEQDDQPTTTQNLVVSHIHSECNDSFTWNKPILITGKPGAGKTLTIQSVINELLPFGANILVASPTGFLSSIFKAQLGDNVTCDTVHAAFHYPVDANENARTNWTLSQYNLIVIDEVSMIANDIFEHVMATINRLLFRPVFVVCGDPSQQQPFQSTERGIVTVSSALTNQHFLSNTYRYNLTGQHRVEDDVFQHFLDHIRNWTPSQKMLDEIQLNRVICDDDNLLSNSIHDFMQSHPDFIFLTFTNKGANIINNIASNTLFADMDPLATIKMDCDLPSTEIYKGMRVVITQNRDKSNNVVNGQLGYIVTVQNNTVFLRLPNNNIVAIYMVTQMRDGTQITHYPLRMAYANTMCKAQGQTLKKAVLWFDVPIIPKGCGYVALSRVKRLSDLFFLMPLKPEYFIPVQNSH